MDVVWHMKMYGFDNERKGIGIFVIHADAVTGSDNIHMKIRRSVSFGEKGDWRIGVILFQIYLGPTSPITIATVYIITTIYLVNAWMAPYSKASRTDRVLWTIQIIIELMVVNQGIKVRLIKHWRVFLLTLSSLNHSLTYLTVSVVVDGFLLLFLPFRSLYSKMKKKTTVASSTNMTWPIRWSSSSKWTARSIIWWELQYQPR